MRRSHSVSEAIHSIMEKTIGTYQTITDTGVVVIGRNEGERLVRCLRSLSGWSLPIVYVDSGSTDTSRDQARETGATVVELDLAKPFTAARARNAGYAALKQKWKSLRYVQFIDGDCEIDRKWLMPARSFLEQHKDVAIVGGRRREIAPQASVYNWLCDREWSGPAGEVNQCGGDTLMRVKAFDEVSGFSDGVIAGEEPELCIRLRDRGWKIWRLDADITRHDAAMSRFSQWWRRCERGGYGMLQVFLLQRRSKNRLWGKDCLRAVMYGGLIPLCLLLAFWHPVFAAAALLIPLSMLRIASRYGLDHWDSWRLAFFMTLGKVPQFLGMLRYVRDSLLQRNRTLIEYK